LEALTPSQIVAGILRLKHNFKKNLCCSFCFFFWKIKLEGIFVAPSIELLLLKLWHKLENLLMEFKKLQSLVELDLSNCSQLGCLHDAIVHLSQVKTFRLLQCDKLENLLVEFEKLQSLVELDISYYFQLGCLLDSIVHLSQLKTFRLSKCHKLENLLVEFRKLQSSVEL